MSATPVSVAGNPVVMAYTAEFRSDPGGVTISIPDFPEAGAQAGDQVQAEALAGDLLGRTIADRIATKQPIPLPTSFPRRPDRPDRRWRRFVVEHTLALRALVWDNMRVQGVSNSELARQLGCDEKEIRRMLDPEARSLSRLSEALEMLIGAPPAVTIVDVGAPGRVLRASTERSRPSSMRLKSAVAAAGAEPVQEE